MSGYSTPYSRVRRGWRCARASAKVQFLLIRCFRVGVKYIDNMKIYSAFQIWGTLKNNGCQEHPFRELELVRGGEAGVARLLHHSEQQPSIERMLLCRYEGWLRSDDTNNAVPFPM
jgi:hypothetical protein